MDSQGMSLLRILVCTILGSVLILLGASAGIFGILMVGLGVLVVIYGFSPRTAEDIISAVVEIVTAPFKH